MNRFELYHGCFKIDDDFESDVLNVFVHFLNLNPSENIICSLKPEHVPKNNTREFGETFWSYVSKYIKTIGIYVTLFPPCSKREVKLFY